MTPRTRTLVQGAIVTAASFGLATAALKYLEHRYATTVRVESKACGARLCPCFNVEYKPLKYEVITDPYVRDIHSCVY